VYSSGQCHQEGAAVSFAVNESAYAARQMNEYDKSAGGAAEREPRVCRMPHSKSANQRNSRTRENDDLPRYAC